MVGLEQRKKTFVILGVVVAVSDVALISYNKYRAKQAAALLASQVRPVEVLVTTVAKQDVPLIKEWIGTTQGDVNADIYAKVSGYLLKKDYQEGSSVKQGDVMFEIDPRQYQASIDSAQGDLVKAQANQKKSQADVRRYSSLVGEGAVSQKEYTDAIRTNDMNKAAISSAQAALEQAKLNLAWTKVTAPISGVAGLAIAQVGDLIDPTKKLTTVSVTDPMKITFVISENEYIWHQKLDMERQAAAATAAAANKDGNSTGSTTTADDDNNDLENKPNAQPDITIILNDGSVYPEKGEFAFMDRQIDQNTGTMTVQVKVANHNGFLRPGQYAKVRAKVGMFKDALVIPRKAVIETQGTAQVAVVSKDNKVEMRDIGLGYIFDNNRIVNEGLKEGDVIVVEGFLKIKEGTIVNPKKE